MKFFKNLTSTILLLCNLLILPYISFALAMIFNGKAIESTLRNSEETISLMQDILFKGDYTIIYSIITTYIIYYLGTHIVYLITMSVLETVFGSDRRMLLYGISLLLIVILTIILMVSGESIYNFSELFNGVSDIFM